ncbi:MAG: hypothetical protein KC466_02370, partial [Myxococcales bacterium]|nr:hypothetical protein [Myxococcales bacterium]
MEGLTIATGEGWDTGSAARLSEGDDIDGTGAVDVNVRIEVCCPRTQSSLPVVGGLQCTQVSSSTACDDDETRHTVTAWEDGPSISTDGTKLFYNYNVVDFANQVTCLDLCTNSASACAVHCGAPIYGPLRDATTGDNRILEATLASGAWGNSAASYVDDLDAANVSDRAPSTAFDATEGDFLAFSRNSGGGTGPDLYLSELVSGAWDTPVNIDDDPDNAPYINTDCEEENPHLVRDADGLRLYFESNRKWYFNDNGTPSPYNNGSPYTAANQPNVPWDDAGNDCTESMRNLFVTYLEDGQSNWTEPIRVDVPDADHDDTSWADIRKSAPFVTPGDPTGGTRQIYWVGRADDCYPLAGLTGDPGASNVDESEASLGCIYRAQQSGDQAIGAAWSNVTKIVTPTPILYGALGDTVVVSNPSVTGDRSYLYFTYIERGKAPDDVEPPIDLTDSLDDTDPLNPLASNVAPGLLIGDVPLWQNWRFTKGLADPANYDAGSGDTTGWEDSVNISADGRTLYFGYSPWILGQGLYAGPDYCADPQSSGCKVGRRVVPRLLANGPTRDSTAGNPSSNGPKGVSIYEATIDTTANPTEWDVVFSEVNYEHYCLPPGTNAGQCQGTPYSPSSECPYECLSEHTVCLNDILGETSIAPDDGVCFTSKDQGYNEGAVTVSTADDGVDHMVFVRYGDIAQLVPSAPLTSPPETISWRMYTSTRSCGTSGSGTGTHWCTPVMADFTIQDSAYSSGADERFCDDNDPHLTAHATSVYFDSRRHLIDTSNAGRCVYKDLTDTRVYNSQLVSGSWSTPLPILGGPNLAYVLWTDPNCDECTGTGNDSLTTCPAYCAPDSSSTWANYKAYGAHQPFVPEDESGIYFVGDGRDCNPD